MIVAPNLRVFLAPGTTDLRKSINGLSALVEEELKLDPFTGYLFGFCDKGRDLVKLLYWDRNGFALWMKRLEKDRFNWPDATGGILDLTGRELRWLFDGLDWKRPAFAALTYQFTG